MSLFSVVFVVLLTLKLLGLIAVSWLVVFAPLLVGVLFFFLWGGLILIGASHAGSRR